MFYFDSFETAREFSVYLSIAPIKSNLAEIRILHVDAYCDWPARYSSDYTISLRQKSLSRYRYKLARRAADLPNQKKRKA